MVPLLHTNYLLCNENSLIQELPIILEVGIVNIPNELKARTTA
jgi:hypothetical protein